jgi:DNA-binding transcriptional LysR family regulator
MPLDPAQLCKHPAILPAAGTYTREVIEQAFQPLGLSIPIRMATNYLETIKMMVSVGLGWSVLPRSMLSDELRVLTVSDMQLSRRLGAVWHGGRTLSNAAQAMLDYLPAFE